METAAQREATWNGTVHSFDSQVLALRKIKKERQKRNGRGKRKRENGTIFSVFLVTLQLNGLSVLQIRSFKCF